jgi:hypothetical protein
MKPSPDASASLGYDGEMDVSKYKTVGEWYRAVRGRVPIQMPAGIQKLMDAEGLTFPEAYAKLVQCGAIIEIDEPSGER